MSGLHIGHPYQFDDPDNATMKDVEIEGFTILILMLVRGRTNLNNKSEK